MVQIHVRQSLITRATSTTSTWKVHKHDTLLFIHQILIAIATHHSATTLALSNLFIAQTSRTSPTLHLFIFGSFIRNHALLRKRTSVRSAFNVLSWRMSFVVDHSVYKTTPTSILPQRLSCRYLPTKPTDAIRSSKTGLQQRCSKWISKRILWQRS